MAVDRRYYHDWTAPINGHRYRIVVTPWGYDTLDITTSQPAYGAGSSGDYYQIPRGVIPMGEIKPSAQFDDLPIGLMDSPGMSLTLDYGPMAQLIAEGATELTDLWGVLQDPEQVPTGSLAVDPSTYTGPDPWIVTTTITGSKIRTGNYFELLTDGGDSTLGIGAFKVVGAWVQHIVDEPEETYNPKSGSDTLKIEMTGAFRYAAEVITPEMINLATQTVGEGNAEIVSELVDCRWSPEAGVVFERLLGDPLDGPIPDFYRRFYMYRLVDLFAGIDALLERVYERLIRADVDFNFSGVLGSLRMYDWVDLREQTEDPDGAASSTRVTVPYFPAFVDWADDPDVYVDGWLFPSDDAGKDKLYGYTSAYDLLKAMIEGAGTIGLLSFSGNNRQIPELSMLGVLGDGNPDLDVEAGDFKGDAWVMRRAKRLTAARADLTGTGSGDVNEVTYRSRAVANDSPRLIPVVFNTIPQVGERNDWGQLNSHSPGITYTMRSSLAAHNTLFYMDGAEFIRCHHYVGIAHSITPDPPDPSIVNFQYYTTNGSALPTPTSVDSVTEDVWYPWRLWALEIQKTGGISYAVAAYAATMFGHQQQTLYPTQVSIEKALPGMVGFQADFADGEELTGQPRHATYPGYPVLLKTELDIAAGVSAVELLALGGI